MIRYVLAASLLLAAPAQAAAPSPGVGDLDAVKAHGELRIGADASAGEPYFWLAAGKPRGFEAELGDAIAKKLGVKAVFVQTGWRDLLPALAQGRIDVALNALEVRPDAEAAFTTPYYVSSQAILVRSEQLSCWPYRYDELEDELHRVGLRIDLSTFDPEAENYQVVASTA